jgi:transcriptional regulator with XRE-family HTH domain
MAKSTPALVETSVLEWARVSAGYTVDEAAGKLRTKPKTIENWESGNKRPSIGQVRYMANVYKRPFHFFFLERPPADPPIPHDYRRLPAAGMARYEPALRFQVRDAYERRQLALDLSAERHSHDALVFLAASRSSWRVFNNASTPDVSRGQKR